MPWEAPECPLQRVWQSRLSRAIKLLIDASAAIFGFSLCLSIVLYTTSSGACYSVTSHCYKYCYSNTWPGESWLNYRHIKFCYNCMFPMCSLLCIITQPTVHVCVLTTFMFACNRACPSFPYDQKKVAMHLTHIRYAKLAIAFPFGIWDKGAWRQGQRTGTRHRYRGR